MWKKLKESASGISTDFFSNLFRRRNYEQFGEDEILERESFDANTRKNSDVRDEENNRVYWRKEVHSYNTRSTQDDGFMNTDLVSYNSEPGSLRRRDVDRSCTGYGTDNVTDMRPREFVSHNFGESRSRSPNRVSGELSDLLHSHTQGRYERLDDSEEEINYSDDVTMDTQRDSNVFHSVKDIDPKWGKSSKSSRRRKKMVPIGQLRLGIVMVMIPNDLRLQEFGAIIEVKLRACKANKTSHTTVMEVLKARIRQLRWFNTKHELGLRFAYSQVKHIGGPLSY
ncbi:hypothetical protein FSP39_007862 [Pinctada imbricata]|uniref:Uncharacterized protein n=1 Tax=Pinctada imbricata TaxID=66713 RepID=A0AA89BYZ2_PINIB|nr:hypothetical protein FSP39_007862 [Pinctada imbricata]